MKTPRWLFSHKNTPISKNGLLKFENVDWSSELDTKKLRFSYQFAF
jgi:hypothetical protein